MDFEKVKELSLFTGAGGGVLGSKLLGWKTIGYVEINDYCQKIIVQRIKDGIFDNAPIYDDIQAFLNEGYAEAYQGMVDIITAGFPCQPFSIAGKKLGEKDPRNMWPETLETIRRIRPKFALLENVPGLLIDKYFRRIAGDLAEIFYDCIGIPLRASDIGANHRREREWILAYPNFKYDKRGRQSFEPNSKSWKTRLKFEGCNSNMADSSKLNSRYGNNVNAYALWESKKENGQGKIRKYQWWAVEPRLGRVAYGVANRVDRLKAIGNGQVPAVVSAVWRLLTE